MDNTIIQQGTFTSDGLAKTLVIRNDVNWISVVNLTQSGDTNDAGVNFYWQDGMPNGSAIVQSKTGGGDDIEQTVLAAGGFTVLDTSGSGVGSLSALTSISNAAVPRVLVASTAGLSDGDVVRLINVTGGQQLGGIDFSINVIDGTHFDLEFMTQITASTAGSYRVIAHLPSYQPSTRFITEITQAAQAVVACSVTPNYDIGQKVRIVNPDPAYGMSEINGLQATIVDIDDANGEITIDIDTTGFSAFAFPVSADVPFTPAQVVPFGEDTAEARAEGVSSLLDSVHNSSFLGVQLGAGIGGPAGQADDVILWRAGSSFSVE